MRLRRDNPGALGNAIEAVKRVRSELGNAQSGSHDSRSLQNAFLTWCESWGQREFGNHFNEFPLADELTESYRRVALAPQMSERQMNGFLGSEFSAWQARLEGLAAQLEALMPFAERQGQIVVPDTSAFIEGPHFTEFDWHSLDGISPEAGLVRLVVPILVVEELDALKRDRNGRVSGRARSVLRRLWELHSGDPLSAAEIPGRRATVEVFRDDPWHVRRPVNDEEITERAAAAGEITCRPVVLAASDNAMLYRAAAAGIRAALMPGRPDAPEDERGT